MELVSKQASLWDQGKAVESEYTRVLHQAESTKQLLLKRAGKAPAAATGAGSSISSNSSNVVSYEIDTGDQDSKHDSKRSGEGAGSSRSIDSTNGSGGGGRDPDSVTGLLPSPSSHSSSSTSITASTASKSRKAPSGNSCQNRAGQRPPGTGARPMRVGAREGRIAPTGRLRGMGADASMDFGNLSPSMSHSNDAAAIMTVGGVVSAGRVNRLFGLHGQGASSAPPLGRGASASDGASSGSNSREIRVSSAGSPRQQRHPDGRSSSTPSPSTYIEMPPSPGDVLAQFTSDLGSFNNAEIDEPTSLRNQMKIKMDGSESMQSQISGLLRACRERRRRLPSSQMGSRFGFGTAPLRLALPHQSQSGSSGGGTGPSSPSRYTARPAPPRTSNSGGGGGSGVGASTASSTSGALHTALEAQLRRVRLSPARQGGGGAAAKHGNQGGVRNGAGNGASSSAAVPGVVNPACAEVEYDFERDYYPGADGGYTDTFDGMPAGSRRQRWRKGYKMWDVPGAAVQYAQNIKPSSYTKLEEMLEPTSDDNDDGDDNNDDDDVSSADFLLKIHRMQQLEQASEKDEDVRGWSFEHTPHLVALWNQMGVNESGRPRSASSSYTSSSLAARTASAKVRQAKAVAATSKAALMSTHRARRDTRGGDGTSAYMATFRGGGTNSSGGGPEKHSPTRTTMLRERENSARARKAAEARKAHNGSSARGTRSSSKANTQHTYGSSSSQSSSSTGPTMITTMKHEDHQPSPMMGKVMVVARPKPPTSATTSIAGRRSTPL